MEKVSYCINCKMCTSNLECNYLSIETDKIVYVDEYDTCDKYEPKKFAPIVNRIEI